MCSDSVSVLASEILDFCDAHSLHIACAESLTGGLLSDSFVKIPGASRVFLDLLLLTIFVKNLRYLVWIAIY